MNKVFAAFWYSGILPLLFCTTTIPTTTTTFENHESLSRPQSAKNAGTKAKQNRKQNREKELEKKDKKDKKKGFYGSKISGGQGAKALAEKNRLLEEEQHLQAAVERATAEARQRAFQKVIVEEAAFEARKRVERSVAERAAKALAEKNMRDLLAEREQAERNRLAEALDAEVKRWSSGKEANLRALLSTLQYVLTLILLSHKHALCVSFAFIQHSVY
ncbi:Auxilin-like protein 1 [Camellia lanceoleosa]|uniref:Auxilin-like protein 1 n=1 Tax=Camellia lanceoleosa TaxID=1840588 RepID=A0ACC0HQL7_9ERIC|nr:Auxilin-like protein 1 [Camellia lanceoleosa]